MPLTSGGLIGLIESLYKSCIPGAESGRWGWGGNEQAQDGRRTSDVGIEIDIRQSRHRNIVSLLIQRSVRREIGVNDRKHRSEAKNGISDERRGFSIAIAGNEVAQARTPFATSINVAPHPYRP